MGVLKGLFGKDSPSSHNSQQLPYMLCGKNMKDPSSWTSLGRVLSSGQRNE